jgi:hypothetical protein
VTRYVFISYSHHDAQPYVDRLAAHLLQNGVNVWYDKEIITGDRWVQVIEQKLSAAAALIVIMTPAGSQSRWVGRELDKAEELDLPIFPLLIAGTPFFRLSDLQRIDARAGNLPGEPFVGQLRRLLRSPAIHPTISNDPHIEVKRRYGQTQPGNLGGHADAAAGTRFGPESTIAAPPVEAPYAPRHPQAAAGAGKKNGWALWGFIFAFLLPGIGLILSIVGVVVGGKPSRRRLAVVGLILSSVLGVGYTVGLFALLSNNRNISTATDPGCTQARAAILLTPTTSSDPATIRAEFGAALAGLKNAQSQAQDSRVKSAVGALVSDYQTMVDDMNSGTQLPSDLQSTLDSDANTFDSLCTR